MLLDDLLQTAVDVSIQYFDVDRTTLMHEKKVQGVVHHVDQDQGITVAANGDKSKLFKVPPATQAWFLQLDGSYQVRWSVFRTQEERQDGQHEWWDWEARLEN